MAVEINSGCTRCGECVHLCPNDAISPGTPVYRVNPWLCTECLGFAEAPECVPVCPAGAIQAVFTRSSALKAPAAPFVTGL